jgi:hypothetical protein
MGAAFCCFVACARSTSASRFLNATPFCLSYRLGKSLTPVMLRNLSLATLLSVFLAVVTAGNIERVSFRDLVGHVDDVTINQIKEALTRDGILAIEGIPGFKLSRRNSLADVDSVMLHDIHTKVLPDGTTRKTSAAAFKAGQPRSRFSLYNVGPAVTDWDLELLQRTWEDTLQNSVDGVAVKLSSALDAAVTTSGTFFGDETYHTSFGKKGESWESFSDLMHVGSYLEHIHSYSTDRAKSADTPASIDYHTDAGLFILFAPAIYTADPYDRQAKPADFRYQDAQGHEHAIVVQQTAGNTVKATTVTEEGLTVHTVAPDTLILMIGQGAVQHLNPQLVQSGGKGLRAVPHALTVNNAGVRNW